MENSTIVAIQRELKPTEIPKGTTFVVFGQAFSVALFVAVAQPVFESVLRPYLQRNVPSVDAQKVIDAGASGLQAIAGPGELLLLREAYSHACTRVFVGQPKYGESPPLTSRQYVTVGAGLASFVCACGMKWTCLLASAAVPPTTADAGLEETDKEVRTAGSPVAREGEHGADGGNKHCAGC